MKKYIFFLLFILTGNSAAAQSNFQHIIDIENSEDHAAGVAICVDGYIFLSLTGCYNATQTCLGLVRTTELGEVVWKRQYDLGIYNFRPGFDGLLVDNEKIVITGDVDSSGTEKPFLMALDLGGNKLWYKHYDDFIRAASRKILKTE